MTNEERAALVSMKTQSQITANFWPPSEIIFFEGDSLIKFHRIGRLEFGPAWADAGDAAAAFFDALVTTVVPSWAASAEVKDKRTVELEAEVERLTYDGIHSCHDQCQRVACVLERRVDELEMALQKIRDRKWDTMKQGCDAAAAAMTIAEKALGETK